MDVHTEEIIFMYYDGRTDTAIGCLNIKALRSFQMSVTLYRNVALNIFIVRWLSLKTSTAFFCYISI